MKQIHLESPPPNKSNENIKEVAERHHKYKFLFTQNYLGDVVYQLSTVHRSLTTSIKHSEAPLNGIVGIAHGA